MTRSVKYKKWLRRISSFSAIRENKEFKYTNFDSLKDCMVRQSNLLKEENIRKENLSRDTEIKQYHAEIVAKSKMKEKVKMTSFRNQKDSLFITKLQCNQ